MDKAEHLNVTVTYPAAERPYQEHEATPSETLTVLKPKVLAYFHLTEGTGEGGTVTYVFYLGKEKLTDLTVTIGSLAGHASALTLKLSQQIEQGAL
jgi:hypothetical protein